MNEKRVWLTIPTLGKTEKGKLKAFCKREGIQVKWDNYVIHNEIQIADYNVGLVKRFLNIR